MQIGKKTFLGFSLAFLGVASFNLFQLDCRVKAQKFSAQHKILSKGSIAHAFANYRLSGMLGQEFTRFLGGCKEFVECLFSGFSLEKRRDSWRDKWNNDVGLKIRAWAADKDISHEDVWKLILDAYDNGHMIKYVEDKRIHLGVTPRSTWVKPSENWHNIFKTHQEMLQQHSQTSLSI